MANRKLPEVEIDANQLLVIQTTIEQIAASIGVTDARVPDLAANFAVFAATTMMLMLPIDDPQIKRHRNNTLVNIVQFVERFGHDSAVNNT